MEGSFAVNYPQFTQLTDRRQQNLPVTSERRFIKQVNKYDSATSKELNPVFEGVLCVVPNARRVFSVEDNTENGNTLKAIGLGAIGLINIKEDLRDLLSVVGLSKADAPKGYYSRFKFFQGTSLEKHLKKSELGLKLLNNYDKTVAETCLGDKIQSFLNINEDVQRCTKETKFPFCQPERILRNYVKHEGSFIGRLACLTMNRITKIGTLLAILMELPFIYKSIKDKNDYSQIPKSGITVLSSTFCGALFSAFGSLATKSSAGSVIGLGLGIFAGNKLSKFIFKDN